ncbi:MAG: DUF3047 domain-containing protein [Candidatus Eisenbacteria bacterium]|uniref:DUF3047 domain-containing protein n=1 Tax=Eiseniibacteriota bacterium TaxID=2212470 RepID=A0A849SI85_UNCEI|nr:DUF3047 domain-containing protein [Candidatus Eisenbacteria bacterium]
MTLGLVLAMLVQLGWQSTEALRLDWHEVAYRGRTHYSVERDSSDVWLHADAIGQHSALFHALDVKPQGVGLRWRWRVIRHPAGANTNLRSRDDRAAAVFVLIHRSVLPWRTRGLIYQWVEGQERGPWRPSPYAHDIRVITLEHSAAGGTWRSEVRDLEADLRAAFGELPKRIEAIGVLSDADNTRDRAIADFGAIEVSIPGDSVTAVH